MNEKEYELLKAELKRLQRECDELRKQQEQEVEPPLHLALVISVSDDKNRAIVLTSKRTLLEVSVRYKTRDVIQPNFVVGLTRIGMNAVKVVEMSGSDFKQITKGIED